MARTRGFEVSANFPHSEARSLHSRTRAHPFDRADGVFPADHIGENSMKSQLSGAANATTPDSAEPMKPVAPTENPHGPPPNAVLRLRLRGRRMGCCQARRERTV